MRLALLVAFEADVFAEVGVLILFIVAIIACLYELPAVKALLVLEGSARVVLLEAVDVVSLH